MGADAVDRTIYGVQCARTDEQPLRRSTLAEARGSADSYDALDTCGPHVVLVSHDGGTTWKPVSRG